jgi:hypothetical protein
MIKFNKKTLTRAAFLLLVSGLTFSCDRKNEGMPVVDVPQMAPDVMFTALTDNNRIAKYQARNLDAPVEVLTISGLSLSEKIVSIDYRPATGQLYALGSSSRLYLINENSGVATALGNSPFSPAIEGENASIDFNPTVDRIRLVTASGQNLRLHPELGTVVATDGIINGGTNPKIGAVAYTNSMAGASTTTLYDIDFEGDKLFIQTPPNDGGLQEVGDLKINIKGKGGFDINPDNSAALLVANENNQSRLFSIDLTSGRAKWVGKFKIPIIGIAFKTNPVAFAANCDNEFFRFDPMSPTENKVNLMGMMTGEFIVGLDFRPVNGALYAVTNKSRLLTVNTANGQVTPVGSGLSPMLAGSTFGFDFNPTVDRIRLVSNTGQNLRLHPDLGTVVFTDGNLNPGSPVVNGAAYTNSFAGSTSTTLYVLDSETDMLYTQVPPNDGVLVPVGRLGINFKDENGFDIGGTSNNAFAYLKVGEGSAIYSINLSTGAASKVSDFNVNVTAMALGLGF